MKRIEELEKKISEALSSQLLNKLNALETSISEIRSIQEKSNPSSSFNDNTPNTESIDPADNRVSDTQEIAYFSSQSLFFRQVRGNRDHVEVTVKGKPYVGPLDGGAQVNVIGRNWFTELEDWGDELLQPNLILTTWDRAARYTSLGVVNVPYTFNVATRTWGKPFMNAFHIKHQQDINAMIQEERELNSSQSAAQANAVGCINAGQFWNFAHYEINATTIELKDFTDEPLEQAGEMVPKKDPCVTLPHTLTPERKTMKLSSQVLYLMVNHNKDKEQKNVKTHSRLRASFYIHCVQKF